MQSYLDNCLITGGYGMIGSTINFGVKPTSTEMDITDYNSIQNYTSKLPSISCILHLAALNLRDSENDYNKALNVNVNGTIEMLKVAKKLNIPFILVSTGAVFSSTNPNYRFDENHILCPNSKYGNTKSIAENVTSLYDKSIIVRTGWMFGGNQKTHYKFVEQTINNLVLNKQVKASNDFYGSPTFVFDFIEKLKYLIINLKFGIHHVVNEGFASGYDIALEICNFMNKDPKLINSVLSQDVPNSGPKRSNSEMLISNYKHNQMRNWKIALLEYVNYYLGDTKIDKDNSLIIKPKVWSNRENCRLCNSTDLNDFFNLEPTPPANHFKKSPQKVDSIPLDICKCNSCKHIQLKQIVDPDYQYLDYFYVSSTSKTMTLHLQKSVDEFTKYLNLSKEDCILEIGANDGTCIKHLMDQGFTNVIGVDPAKNINDRHNLPIICDFFGSNIITKLESKYKPLKLIYAFHCCAHIENIKDIFHTANQLLDDEGSFVIEVGYFYQVFINKLFDVIYHEHIDYHTVTAMNVFSQKMGFTLYKISENTIQGGSIQFFMSKNKNIIIDKSVDLTIQKESEVKLFDSNNLQSWKTNIIQNGKDINYLLNSLIQNGKIIAGYGASAKSTTFLHQYNLSNHVIKFIIDDNIYKQNYYTPGLNIPIKTINILDLENVDYIIILSWNFCEEIISKLEKYIKVGMRIIVPFPCIKIM